MKGYCYLHPPPHTQKRKKERKKKKQITAVCPLLFMDFFSGSAFVYIFNSMILFLSSPPPILISEYSVVWWLNHVQGLS
jgi:hypothetical protein